MQTHSAEYNCPEWLNQLIHTVAHNRTEESHSKGVKTVVGLSIHVACFLLPIELDSLLLY